MLLRALGELTCSGSFRRGAVLTPMNWFWLAPSDMVSSIRLAPTEAAWVKESMFSNLPQAQVWTGLRSACVNVSGHKRRRSVQTDKRFDLVSLVVFLILWLTVRLWAAGWAFGLLLKER